MGPLTLRQILTVYFSMKYWETGDIYYLLRSLVTSSFKAASSSKLFATSSSRADVVRCNLTFGKLNKLLLKKSSGSSNTEHFQSLNGPKLFGWWMCTFLNGWDFLDPILYSCTWFGSVFEWYPNHSKIKPV